MEYYELLTSAFQSLRSNLMRTLLTMLGIIIGIASVILIVSIGQGAVKFITNELSSFGTNYFSIQPGNNAVSAISGTNTLTMEDVEAIRKDQSLSNVDIVAPVASSSQKVSANGIEKNILLQGVTPEMFDIINPEIVDGDFISEDDILGSSRVAVIGVDAVETFFGTDANPVGETIKIDNKTFRIIGIAKTNSAFFGNVFNNTLYVPLNVLSNQIVGEEKLQEIEVSVKNTDIINETITDVEVLLRDRHNIEEGEDSDFHIQNFLDALATVQTVTSMLTAMIAMISAISLVVGGVGVMNIMLVTVTERTKEIGLLKAIGAKQQDILRQFLLEAVVITLCGGLIGIAIGVFGAYVVSSVAKIPFVVSVPSILMATGVSIGVGVVFGLYPARRAARLSPIDALRYE